MHVPDEKRIVPLFMEVVLDVLVAHSAEDRGVGNLVAVQVKDRQNGPIVRRVEELIFGISRLRLCQVRELNV
jgi:hypothetical protein